MEEIMHGMQEVLPNPHGRQSIIWLNTYNIATTIPGWYERVDQFISDGRMLRCRVF
jgi:hypothetical protein